MIRDLLFLFIFLLKYLKSCHESRKLRGSEKANGSTLCWYSFANYEGNCVAPRKQIDHCLHYQNYLVCQECEEGFELTDLNECQAIEIADCSSVDGNKNCQCCSNGNLVQNNSC